MRAIGRSRKGDRCGRGAASVWAALAGGVGEGGGESSGGRRVDESCAWPGLAGQDARKGGEPSHGHAVTSGEAFSAVDIGGEVVGTANWACNPGWVIGCMGGHGGLGVASRGVLAVDADAGGPKPLLLGKGAALSGSKQGSCLASPGARIAMPGGFTQSRDG